MPLLAQKVPRDTLFVSEPPANWFGNRENPSDWKAANWSNANWLKSRFHFSFAEYSDRERNGFGVLRVVNDDLVQPDRGFGTHPHSNMEICTYIVSGALTHKDSMGTQETLGRGSVQFMTAGMGIRHSEHNLDKSNPLRFIQIWIHPTHRNLNPNYGGHIGIEDERKNKFAHLVTSVNNKAAVSVPIKINQDANMHVAEIDNGKHAELGVGGDRQAYVLCMEGKVLVEELDVSGNPVGTPQTLVAHDGLRLIGQGSAARVRFSAQPATREENPAQSSIFMDRAHVLVMEIHKQ